MDKHMIKKKPNVRYNRVFAYMMTCTAAAGLVATIGLVAPAGSKWT